MRAQPWRARLIIGALAVAVLLGGAVLAAWLAFFVKPEAFLNSAVEDADPRALEVRLRGLHRTTAPCLRYVPDPVSDARAALVADRILEAGLDRDQFTDLIGRFIEWADAHEAGAHEDSQLDEMIGTRSLPLTGKLVLWLHRDRVEKMFEMDLEQHRRDATRVWDALSATQQKAVRAAWEEDPEAFVIGGMLRVVRQLAPKLTVQRMDALAARLREVRQSEGKLPARLEDLGLPATSLQDGWYGTIAYEQVGSGFRLLSSGGGDVEIVREYDLEQAAGDVQSAEVTPPDAEWTPQCPTLPCTVTLVRADVEAAFADTSALSMSARIVPAFQDGEARGFKIFAIKGGSLWARAGFEDGDVITTVNGMSVSSPDKALSVYSTIKDAERVTFAVERKATPGEITVLVK